MVRNKILSASFAAMVGAAVFASGGSASAGITFSVDPTAQLNPPSPPNPSDILCTAGTCGPFSANQIQGSYTATILQTVGGTNPFTELGGFLFNGYLTGMPEVGVPAGTTGLNLGPTGYQLFANFQGSGTATLGNPTTVTFMPPGGFTFQLWGLQGAVAPALVGSQFVTAGATELASATILFAGNAHAFFSGPAQGDYAIFSNFLLTPAGNLYFTSLASLLSIELHNSGNNNLATQCSANAIFNILNGIPSTNNCIVLSGAGIAEFLTIPEPTSLALFGMGLLALGMISRRRKTAA